MITNTFDELKLSGNLPSPSGVGMRILELTRSDDYDTDEIGTTIMGDSALTGRILKLANSASNAGHEPATTVAESIMRLGTQTVRDLALAFSLVSERKAGNCRAFDYDFYWTKSLARAVCAQELCRELDFGKPEEGYICGLLGEVGKLAMASVFTEQYAEILLDESAAEDAAVLALETEKFGINHAQTGACMLREWGLPEEFCKAVLEFSEATTVPDAETKVTGLSTVLHFADMLADVLVVGEETPNSVLIKRSENLDELQAFLKLEQIPFETFCKRCSGEWVAWGKSLDIATSDARFSQVAARMQAAAVEGAGENRPAKPVRKARPADVAPCLLGEDQQVRILCIDDDLVCLRALEAHLAKWGYEVVAARDGKQGLKVALEANPDIVIADWQMPGLDGLELCKSLRRTEAGRRMYFLLLTGTDGEENIVQAFDAEVDDYVVKPIVPRLLSARIKGGLRLARLQHKVEKDKQTMMRQVAELGMLTRKLRALSLTDVLTEIPNRRYAMKRLETEWSSTMRTSRPLSLIMLDIDHFKSINDEYGHDAGDLVLRETAQFLRSCFRTTDEVCRIGGEEFLVICQNTGAEDCQMVAERVRVKLADNVVQGPGYQIKVTMSLGVSSYEPSIANPAALLKAADEAVYRAKQEGRDRVCVAPTIVQESGSVKSTEGAQ